VVIIIVKYQNVPRLTSLLNFIPHYFFLVILGLQRLLNCDFKILFTYNHMFINCNWIYYDIYI